MTNDKMHRLARIGLAVLVLAAVLVIITIISAPARAQGLSLPPIGTWFESPFAWGGVVLTLVAFIRANFAKGLKGPAVLLLSFGLSIGGSVAAALGLLQALGVAYDATLGEALILGVLAGGFAGGLWDLGTSVAQVFGRASGQALAAQSLVNAQAFTALPSPESVTDYVLALVRDRFGSSVPTYVWSLVETIAREFAGKALTEDVRAAIQRRFLDLLARVGAPGRDL